MDVGLGMQLLTRDGKDAGTAERLILDPDTGTVRTIVIRKGTILPREIEVPMGALEVESDGNVRLSYTADQIDELPPFIAHHYGPPPSGYASLPGYAVDEGADMRSDALERRDKNVVIQEGSAVLSRDSKEVGAVHRLTYEPNSGVLRHFVVREGVLFTKDVALPASLIARFDDDLVQLRADAIELRDHEIA